LFSDKFKNKTIIVTSAIAHKNKIKGFTERGIQLIACNTNNGMIITKEAMKEIAKMHITSIIVEGGARTYTEFLKHKLVDELMIFIAPKIMGSGIDAFRDKINLDNYKRISYFKIDRDILINVKK
jgi:diaminohydroxyphosphoribosylaminopyrimidine deaminase/5-amino-6-(5-phosphoribosylamino)uracil reductase